MGNDNSSIASINSSHHSIDSLSNEQSNSTYSILALILTVVPILIIIVIIVSGNALVIYAVMKEDRLKNKTQNWLILSLSVADLLVGLMIMPLTLTYEILGKWTLGTALCEIWLALDVLFVTASILNLCVISIDRYWSLSNPTYSATKRTRGRTLSMIACIWILAFAICLPPLAGWRPVRIPGKCNLSDDVGYVLYSSLGSFYLPLGILIFIYVKIFQITRRRALVQRRKVEQRENLLLLASQGNDDEPTVVRAALRAKTDSRKALLVTGKGSVRLVARASSSTSPNCTLSIGTPMVASSATVSVSGKGTLTTLVDGDTPVKTERAPSGADAVISGLLLKPLELQIRIMQHRKQLRRKERQATLLLGLILGAFTICWLPFFFVYLMGALCCTTSELVFDVFFWMGYVNSAINPLLYNFCNPDFRQAFRRILCGRKRRRF